MSYRLLPRFLGLVALAALVGCGEAPLAPDAERREAAAASAVEFANAGRWWAAADAWSRAFALSDPVADPPRLRARFAFGAGRAFTAGALALHADPLESSRAANVASAAFLWLDEAEALAPSFLATAEPRARLLEAGFAGGPQHERAQHLRQRFVEGVEARGGREVALESPDERAAFDEARESLARDE